jgi:hypothetical protein
MYRDDQAAQAARANALIDEIAQLEREKLAHTATDQRLEDAKRALATLQPTTAVPVPTSPSVAAHVAVFCVASCATFALYTLLF